MISEATKAIMGMRTARVFMSYSREDNNSLNGGLAAFAEEVVGKAGSDFELFIDKASLRPGEQWPDQLKFEVRRADVLMAFVSNRFLRSKWCKNEYEEFLKCLKVRGFSGGPRPILLAMLQPMSDQEPGEGDTIASWIDSGIEHWLEADQMDTVIKHDPADTAERIVSEAANELRNLVESLAPAHPALIRDRGPTPAREQYQYLGAFDSVYTQRGTTDHNGFVQLRAKLSYLLGYTMTLSQTHVFDSLGAIECVSQAARAWTALGQNEVPPVPPFRFAYFDAPHSNLMDLALEKLRNKKFESSAWYRHEHHRVAVAEGHVDLEQAQEFHEWQHLQYATNFLSWFPCDRVAKVGSKTLHQRLRDAHRTGLRRLGSTPLIEELGRIVISGSSDRSQLYGLVDKRRGKVDNSTLETLKDVVDIAYNRTVAVTVLLAATRDHRNRSMVLTTPTPESRGEEVQQLVWHLIDPQAEESAANLERLTMSAWEGNSDLKAPGDAPEIEWEYVFTIAGNPAWVQKRNDAIEARNAADDPARRFLEAMEKLAHWVSTELRENLSLRSEGDGVLIELAERDEIAGLGDSEPARERETGGLSHDVEDE